MDILELLRPNSNMAKFTREELEAKLAAGERSLQRVDLGGANLRGTNLRSADLSGANLSGADLSEAHLGSARYNADTKWPEGFDPVAAGAVLVD